MNSLSCLQWEVLLACLGLLGQFLLNEPPAPIPLSWGIMTTKIGKLPPPIAKISYEDAATCQYALN